MREIFFARDTFTLPGEGDFTGTFHLFKGGRELKGNFTSREAGVNDYRFPNLEGSLVWVPDRIEVTRATADFSGGTDGLHVPDGAARQAGQPARAVFDVDYRDVDLNALTEFYEMRGLRLAGRACGHNEMSWPLGRYAERRGSRHRDASRRSAALQGPRARRRTLPPTARERYRIAGPVQQPHAADAGRGRRATSPTRSTPRRFASSRAASSPKTPTSRSRARPRTASDRRCRSASPAATGRRAIASSPAS